MVNQVLVRLPGEHQQMLDDGAQRDRRKEGQRADDQDHADQQSDEQRPAVGKVPALRRTDFLSTSEPARASAGIFIMKRPSSIATASDQL